jgi:hypothetical protein
VAWHHAVVDNMKSHATPKPTLARISDDVLHLLTHHADIAGRESGFVVRQSKLGGAGFVQALVFGWMANPESSLEQLARTAAVVGVPITPQGLDQRFSAAGAACLRGVLERMIRYEVVAPEIPQSLLDRFSAVFVRDSTTITLPKVLEPFWRGNSGHGTRSTLKIQLEYDLRSGSFAGLHLQHGRSQDRTSPTQKTPEIAGALRIADLGYFDLDVLAADSQHGHFLTRAMANIVFFDEVGERHTLDDYLRQVDADEIDIPICAGNRRRLPCRLVARRAPKRVANQRRRKLNRENQKKGQTTSRRALYLLNWTIFLTSVPPSILSADALFILGRCRWQIELIFKLWKQDAQLDKWRTAKPERILCEIYAKLIGLILRHWIVLHGCWAELDRSLTKAYATISAMALHLAASLRCPRIFARALGHVCHVLASGCRICPSQRDRRTWQLLVEGLA